MDLRATRAIIDINKLYNNLAVYRNKMQQNTQLCFIVKANAYGHGLAKMAIYAEPKVDSFAVATVQEGKTLRKEGIRKAILVLSPHLKEEITDIVRFNLTPVVGHRLFLADYQKIAQEQNIVLPIHLKVDTGMGRVGCHPNEAVSIVKEIQNFKNIQLEGICTHFSHDSEQNISITQKQFELFLEVVDELKELNLCPPHIHASNSSAGLHYQQSQLTMVRVGIGAYGYENDPQIHPILSFQTKIVAVKNIDAGQSVSYNGTWTATEPTQIAVLPVGYADGYLRGLSNKSSVLIDGQLYSIIGAICMDQMMVNITGLDNPLEKEVILYGDYPKLNASELMKQANGISYELLVALAERVPRYYINTPENL